VGSEDDDDDPAASSSSEDSASRRRVVYVVRHAESRYNAGVRAWSLRALMQERDHGLTPRGRAQCAALRGTLETAASAGDADAAAMAAAQRLSSPLRRALATAALAIPTADCPNGTVITALPDAREQCLAPLFARDSEGTPKSHIADAFQAELARAQFSEETSSLGAKDEEASVVAPPTDHECFSLDLDAIEAEEWWEVAESDAAVARRVGSLLVELYRRAERGAPVFVGHSRAIRHMFRAAASAPGVVVDPAFSAARLANCAVVKVVLEGGRRRRRRPLGSPVTDGAEDSCDDVPSIVAADFLFDTTFKGDGSET